MELNFKALDIRLHSLPSAAVYCITQGSRGLAFVNAGVGFVDRAADVFAVGFLRSYEFYVSTSVKPLRPYGPLTPCN
jgi:hypothetical protein